MMLDRGPNLVLEGSLCKGDEGILVGASTSDLDHSSYTLHDRESETTIQAVAESPSIASLLQRFARATGHGVEVWRRTWEDAWALAQAAWPEFEVPAEGFAEHVFTVLGQPAGPEDLGRLHVDELLLVYAVLSGETAALRAFEQRYVHELEGVAARVDAGTADEVVQRLRDRLLVGPEAKLRDYAGTGSLRRWLKVATKRQALDLQRGIGRRRESGSVAVDSFASKVDPELDYIKAHYRAEFREAFASAMQDLEPRSRTMLRLHLVHSLSIDEIAPMHQVHRATVARWIARARSELAERTRAELALRLGVETSEVESVIHLIASRMDITVTRHLQSLSGVDPDSAPQ